MADRPLIDRVLPWLPTLLFVAAMGFAWFGDGGLQDRRELVSALHEVDDRLHKLNEENTALERRQDALRNDPLMLERKAREELGMMRPDEHVFRFIDDSVE